MVDRSQKQQGFYIDKLTNSIEKVATGECCETEIIPMSADEIKTVLKKNGWVFNWKKEFKMPGRQIYKLALKNENAIQGLISLEPIQDQNFIEMHLIENAPHNYSEKKLFAGVAGNMVAFACKMSFDLDFGGFVAFRAKTELVEHYVKTLGAQVIFDNNRMAIFPESAKKLVNLYFENYIND